MKVVLNPKEEMTPLERSKAIAESKDFDRIAMDPFLGEIKAKLINKNTREYWTNEDNLVNAEILAFNRYRADGMGVGPNAYGIAEAMGVIAHYPKQGLIYVEKHPIESIQEIDKFPYPNKWNSEYKSAEPCPPDKMNLSLFAQFSLAGL